MTNTAIAALQYEIVEFANGKFAARLVATPTMFIALKADDVWSVKFAAKYCQAAEPEEARNAALRWVRTQQDMLVVRILP